MAYICVLSLNKQSPRTLLISLAQKYLCHLPQAQTYPWAKTTVSPACPAQTEGTGAHSLEPRRE